MPKAITLQQIEGKPGKVYYPLKITTIPMPKPAANDLVVEIHAVALNHRDLFLRQHLYPAPSFEVPLLADGYGVVTGVGTSVSQSWIGKKVVLMPSRGWKDSTVGPESPKGIQILGGTSTIPLGTGQEVICVDEHEVELAPAHLSPAEAAALPLTGLTAWRALISKSGNAEAGRNILITGIGGGVALNALQFAIAIGANTYITSGSQDKIDKAKQAGAKGGAIYKSEGWEKDLKKILPESRPYFDAIIDGAGGDIVSKAAKILKPGGVIVQYGMTVSPNLTWSMNAVLLNIDLRGTTMGSRKDFKEMIAFVDRKKITPFVSKRVKGLDNLNDIDSLFNEMKNGSQFGKLIIELEAGASSKL